MSKYIAPIADVEEPDFADTINASEINPGENELPAIPWFNWNL